MITNKHFSFFFCCFLADAVDRTNCESSIKMGDGDDNGDWAGMREKKPNSDCFADMNSTLLYFYTLSAA